MSRWSETQNKKLNWGDVDEHDDGTTPLSPTSVSSSLQPTISSSKPDAKGIKTVIEYGTNQEGQKIKITRKIKVGVKQVRMNKHVIARQNWEKFGDCKGLPRGPEQNITYQSFEIIHLDLRPKKREEEKEESSLDKLAGSSSIVVCRNCGETGHWTLKCPKRQQIDAFANKRAPEERDEAPAPEASVDKSGKYIPMHMRGDKKGVSSLRDDTWTLRVTNLSEDVTESDLQDLFRRVGHTQRIYLARDRTTQASRGFAFVNYTNKEDAEAAIKKLNGHGYDNLILHVEWAKPREERERAERGE